MASLQVVLGIIVIFVFYFVMKYLFRKKIWIFEDKKINPDKTEKLDYLVNGRSFQNYQEAKDYARSLK